MTGQKYFMYSVCYIMLNIIIYYVVIYYGFGEHNKIECLIFVYVSKIISFSKSILIFFNWSWLEIFTSSLGNNFILMRTTESGQLPCYSCFLVFYLFFVSYLRILDSDCIKKCLWLFFYIINKITRYIYFL